MSRLDWFHSCSYIVCYVVMCLLQLENWLDCTEDTSNECKDLVHSVNDISRLLDNALVSQPLIKKAS